jgi:hypothetical protein
LWDGLKVLIVYAYGILQHDAYETGCYNLCPGFIQTNNQIAIGGSISQLSPVSIYAGSQYDITILVWKVKQKKLYYYEH